MAAQELLPWPWWHLLGSEGSPRRPLQQPEVLQEGLLTRAGIAQLFCLACLGGSGQGGHIQTNLECSQTWATGFLATWGRGLGGGACPWTVCTSSLPLPFRLLGKAWGVHYGPCPPPAKLCAAQGAREQ